MKRLLTAALPYANGDLHLGGIRSTYLPADIYARFLRLKGHEVLFACATDEHGTPIEVNAGKEGLKPEEFVAKYHERQKKDFSDLGISFDVFHHTHSAENESLAREFYLAAEKKGQTYLKNVEQIFCGNCSRFLPDRFVKGACPFCGKEDQYGDGCEKCGKVFTPKDLKNPHCAICGKTPGSKTVEHVFFKLSSLDRELSDFLDNPLLQKDVVNYVKNWLKELKDWDITRDGPYFGLPIPGRKDQFYYVWFDAPIGYIASVQKWCRLNDEKLEDWWTDDCRIAHFIGKDIVYHHYLFWPAMLTLAEKALPARIPTRGYLNVEGQKMSKSRGTFILLKDVLACFAPDALRYYLTAITPADTTDGNFAWKDLQSRVNNELIGAYGNFVYRSLSFIEKKGGMVPKPGKYDDEDKNFEEKLGKIWAVEEKLENVELKEALEQVFHAVNDANRYFNNRAPWKIQDPQELDTVLYLSAKAAYTFALALSPFLPFSSQKVFESFGVQSPTRWADVSGFKPGLKVSGAKPLFAKLDDDVIASEIAKTTSKGLPSSEKKM